MSHPHDRKGAYDKAADKTASVMGVVGWIAALAVFGFFLSGFIEGFQRWPIVTGIVVYVLMLPSYLFLSVVIGGEGGMNFGEPNRWVLWIVWWPFYGPYRIVRWVRGISWDE